MWQGFYPGGTAIAIRQMTNWASRQGFTEAVRNQFKLRLHGNKKAKLTKAQEVASGILGGAALSAYVSSGLHGLHAGLLAISHDSPAAARL